MRLLNPIKISYKNLMAAKGRSFLTILGIIIGVASVIIIMSIGLSAQALILDQIKGIGSNLIGVLPGASDEEGPPAAVLGISVTTLTYEDLKALRQERNVPEAENSAGYVSGAATIEYGRTSLNASFTGTTANYVDVEDADVVRGRFFNEDEEANLSRVAVLGSTLAADIFENRDPLNQNIKIKDQNFTVIGIFEERGSSAFGLGGQDESVFVPLKTAQKLLLGINHLGYIRMKAKSTELIPFAIDNIKKTLRERHDIDNPADDDFSVRDQAAALDTITNITNVLRYFLLAIGTVSLVVGGVGIMNIMLIAVNQRIREVGLRKAVGAKNRDVLFQFLAESSAISLFGGVIGIFIGIIFSLLVSVIVQKMGYNWPFILSWQSVVVAFVISIFIGIFFGMYPARKASRVSPMEALRYE